MARTQVATLVLRLLYVDLEHLRQTICLFSFASRWQDGIVLDRRRNISNLRYALDRFRC